MDACQFYGGENDGLMTGRLHPAAAPPPRCLTVGGAATPSSGGKGELFPPLPRIMVQEVVWGSACRDQNLVKYFIIQLYVILSMMFLVYHNWWLRVCMRMLTGGGS